MSTGRYGTRGEEPAARRRERRPSYGRFGCGCDDLTRASRIHSTPSTSSDAPLRNAVLALEELEGALDKHAHLSMLILQCIKLRKMRASVSWPPILNEIDRKLVALQARLDAIEFDHKTRR